MKKKHFLLPLLMAIVMMAMNPMKVWADVTAPTIADFANAGFPTTNLVAGWIFDDTHKNAYYTTSETTVNTNFDYESTSCYGATSQAKISGGMNICNLTLSFKIKNTNPSGWSDMFSINDGTPTYSGESDGQIQMMSTNNIYYQFIYKNCFGISTSDEVHLFDAATVGENIYSAASDNQAWHTLTFVFNGQNCKTYIDGTLKATTVFVPTAHKSDVTIRFGCDWNGSRTMTGKLQNVLIYNCALSDNQVNILAGNRGCTHTNTDGTSALGQVTHHDATCTTGSYDSQICSLCNDEVISNEGEINPNAHDLQSVDAVSATCTTAGNYAYWKCSRCSKVFSDENGSTETTIAAVTIAALGGEHISPTDASGYNSNGFATCLREGCEATIYQPATFNNDCYEVSNAGQLYWVAENALFCNVQLTQDITVNQQVLKADGSLIDNPKSLIKWTPIQNRSIEFDGQGHTISGLYFDDETKDNVGFIGYTEDGHVKHLGIINSYFKGGKNVGGIVGWVNDSSAPETIQNCYFTGTVLGTQNVGGLCGNFINGHFTVSNCYTICNGTGAGLIGEYDMYDYDSYIKNCYTSASTAFENGINKKGTLQCIETGVTAERFASGEIAYKLNGSVDSQGTWTAGTGTPVWYQAIGGDAIPTFEVNQDAIVKYNATDGYYNDIGNIESFTLQDGKAYNGRFTGLATSLTYKRTFANTTYNALYVPFAMSYSDWSEKADVYRLLNIFEEDTDDNGTIDKWVLRVVKLKAGESTKANTPYIIKPKTTGEMEFTLSNVTLAPAQEKSYWCASLDNKFVFTGSYAEKTIAANSYFFMSTTGALQYGDTDKPLKPQRWYMGIYDKDTDALVTPSTFNPSNNSAKAISIICDDEEATDISVTPTLSESEGVRKLMENGKIVIVKNGMKYNVNGQMIK